MDLCEDDDEGNLPSDSNARASFPAAAVGGAVGGFILLAVLGVLLLVFLRKRKAKKDEEVRACAPAKTRLYRDAIFAVLS